MRRPRCGPHAPRRSASSKWPSQLRVTVSDGHVDVPLDAALTVVVAVVDGRSPRMPDMMQTTATVLGVSSGAATAEQLARVAVSADADGREITGILVADPEPTDHTTGRIPQLSRPTQRQAADPPEGHDNGDKTVNDPEYQIRTMLWSNGNGIGDYLPERFWALNDFPPDGEPPAAEMTGGLASLKFITAALRRRAKFWCITAVVGLVIGCGLYLKSPPGYQATTSLWLIPGPYENINTAANNDQAMAQTRTVAGLAVQQLGLQESAASFLATYKVAPITERVMVITASARSSNQAVLNANAVAAAFLKFRAQEMETQQALVLASLNQQAKQAQQRLSSINAQIKQLQAQPASSAQQSQLKSLQDRASPGGKQRVPVSAGCHQAPRQPTVRPLRRR